MPTLTKALRAEYERLFRDCKVAPTRRAAVDALTATLVAGRPRYRAVQTACGTPWQLVGVIHAMEAGFRFDRHLHNGDPLTARTTHVPAGRPAKGTPPFTWEASAIDALAGDGLAGTRAWDVPSLLFALERFNGFGYRQKHPDVRSPYLWSFSNHYTRGKFVADGVFSATAVSQQCGAAVLLRRLAETGQLALPGTPAPAKRKPALRWSPDAVVPHGEELQELLNRFPGIVLRPDGELGEKTSDALLKVMGHRLAGDPRTAAKPKPPA